MIIGIFYILIHSIILIIMNEKKTLPISECGCVCVRHIMNVRWWDWNAFSAQTRTDMLYAAAFVCKILDRCWFVVSAGQLHMSDVAKYTAFVEIRYAVLYVCCVATGWFSAIFLFCGFFFTVKIRTHTLHSNEHKANHLSIRKLPTKIVQRLQLHIYICANIRVSKFISLR